MRVARTQSDFIRDPRQRWVGGRTYLVWNWSETLGGVLFWGRPSEEDVWRVYELSDAYHRFTRRCDVVTDVTRIASVEGTAYKALVEGMRQRRAAFAAHVNRHAMVRSEGMLGGLAEGFFPLLGATHSWRIFPDDATAFAWLDRADGEEARQEVARIAGGLSGVPPLIREVRAILQAELLSITVAEVARRLGTSERTLHRNLQKLNTTFRDQVTGVRVEEARKLLRQTDLKVEEIARRVGCSSHAHLTTLFRRATGQTPLGYRSQVGEDKEVAEA